MPHYFKEQRNEQNNTPPIVVNAKDVVVISFPSLNNLNILGEWVCVHVDKIVESAGLYQYILSPPT